MLKVSIFQSIPILICIISISWSSFQTLRDILCLTLKLQFQLPVVPHKAVAEVSKIVNL
jgi:hypothetical protein